MVSLMGGTEKYRQRFFNLSEKFPVQKKKLGKLKLQRKRKQRSLILLFHFSFHE
jgi:hypothetical protein